jgi:hypothetical protein
MRKQRSALVTGATALLLCAFAPAAAAAAEHPNSCPPDNTYSVSGATGTFVPDTSKRVYGQSGVTLSLTASRGTEWSGTVGGSVSGDVGIIVAKAQATIETSITYSKTTTVDLGGSWTVPSNQSSGWLALGSQGFSMHWQYAGYTASCQYRVIRSGTAVLPAFSPYIGHS